MFSDRETEFVRDLEGPCSAVVGKAVRVFVFLRADFSGVVGVTAVIVFARRCFGCLWARGVVGSKPEGGGPGGIKGLGYGTLLEPGRG